MKNDNAYMAHAIREFRAAGWIDDSGEFNDEMQEMICNHVLKLLEVFDGEGHSGSSAPYAVNMFKKLALFEPLTPINGSEDEWSDDNQNIRESALFRDDNGAYYLDAIVFRGQNGSCFTGNGVSLKDGRTISSRQYIRQFPFIPKTFYVDVIETEWADEEETIKKEGGGWWTSVVKDESQLEEVFEYYKQVL